MNQAERRAKISELLIDSSMSRDEKLEVIERTYAELYESALICMNGAVVASEHGDEEAEMDALADCAAVLTYAIGGADIVLGDHHREIITKAQDYVDTISEDEDDDA